MYNDNLARKLDTHSYNGNISVSAPRKLKAPQKKTRINVDKAVKLSIFLIVFVLGSLLVLGKNVKVTEQGKKVSKLKEEYSSLSLETFFPCSVTFTFFPKTRREPKTKTIRKILSFTALSTFILVFFCGALSFLGADTEMFPL